ncbi:hypothetical protein TA05_03895 [Citrobacter rodentium]|jgi:hypothetical protein|uniref:Uncharacterized protein n=1 Tax=Citrobacter rodentium (strain ICC168) TaxID=637910 RepID=D2TRF8_CITRI|nr:hypothetical protein TA05_03895 [Citrobacter rodentium]CBG89004.1 hypothetical protein ROD_22561 [Citrobacter rodentium ICC168]
MNQLFFAFFVKYISAFIKEIKCYFNFKVRMMSEMYFVQEKKTLQYLYKYELWATGRVRNIYDRSTCSKNGLNYCGEGMMKISEEYQFFISGSRVICSPFGNKA